MSKIEQGLADERDFDHWMQLAASDPDAFEVARQAAIDELIESFQPDSRDRLRRLQWRIDQERRLAKSPMGACMRLSKMMWRQLLGEGGLRDRLLGLGADLSGQDALADHPGQAGGSAQVLAFSRAAD